MSAIGGADRKALVAAMRAFKLEDLDLTLLRGKKASRDAGLDTSVFPPLSITVFASAAVFIAFAGWTTDLGLLISTIGSQISGLYLLIFFNISALVALTLGAVWGFRRRLKLLRGVWEALMALNNFSSPPPGQKLPTAFTSKPGVVSAAQMSGAATSVCFGAYDGSFDPDHHWDFKGKYDPLVFRLFVDVEVPQLGFEPVICTPQRPPNFDLLPKMNEKAKTAIVDFSSNFAVVVGRGHITMTHAGALYPPNDNPLAGLMTDPDCWPALIGIINNQMADVIEGLEV